MSFFEASLCFSSGNTPGPQKNACVNEEQDQHDATHIFNEQLTEGPRETSESPISMKIDKKKKDYDQNLMQDVDLSVKSNSLTHRNISLLTVLICVVL